MSAAVDVEGLNGRLSGVTELLGFQLTRVGGKYELSLALGTRKTEKLALTLICRDVQNLELNPGGDGFEQMPQLHVADLREDGLDRIRYSIEELERETLFLHCAEIVVISAI